MAWRELSPTWMFRSLHRHRDLTRQLAWRAFTSRYKGSLLGSGWAVLYPLIMLGIYTVVFGYIFGGRWSRMVTGSRLEYALGMFCGLVPFNYFSELMNRSPYLVTAVPNYVKKVVFPLETLSASEALAGLANMGISLAILLVAATFLLGGPHVPHATVLLLPLAILPLVAMCLGLSWFLASLGAFVRDIGPSVVLCCQILIFLTPVFYDIENPEIPPLMRQAMRLNPLSAIVDTFRRTILWGELPNWQWLAATALLSVVVLTAGWAWFAKSRRAFSDVL